MMRAKFYRILVAMSLFACLHGVALAQPLDADHGKEEGGAAAVAKVPDLPPETPVAKVDGRVITKRELELSVNSYIANVSRNMGGKHSQAMEVTDKLREEMLSQMVEREVLFGEVEKHQYPEMDQKVADEFAKRKAVYKTDEEFQADLKRNGIDEEGLKKLMRRGLSLEAYVDSYVVGKGLATDEEAKKFYDANPSYFVKNGDEVRASHILVATQKSDDQAKKDAAKAKAEEIRKKLEGGADFAELAKTSSDCPSKDQGGDLGFFGKGRMVKAFEDAAFTLEPGKLSPVVESEFGYHVIKVTEKKAPESYTFDEVKEKIINYLVNQELAARIKELKKTVKIEIL